MYAINSNCNHKGFKDYKNYEAQLFTYTILSCRIYFSDTDVTLPQQVQFLNGLDVITFNQNNPKHSSNSVPQKIHKNPSDHWLENNCQLKLNIISYTP